MNRTAINAWQDVRREVQRRIHAREWKPGAAIPNETDLARSFGCARATVNRALRSLAEDGVLDRRRKAGTRVALHPVQKATLPIPVIRHEIEGRGMRHAYALIRAARSPGPPVFAGGPDAGAAPDALHLLALHSGDGAPYVIEDRWINLTAVPVAGKTDFNSEIANEWLLANVPYTHGDIAFSARAACAETAARLNVAAASALFTVERTTWDAGTAITTVTLSYAPGYRLNTRL